MFDRRTFARFAVDFPAEVRMTGSRMDFAANVCDVSATGVGLVLDTRLTPKSILDLVLKFPDAQSTFNGLARVIWSKQISEGKWRAGLEFAQVNLMKMGRALSFATNQ